MKTLRVVAAVLAGVFLACGTSSGGAGGGSGGGGAAGGSGGGAGGGGGSSATACPHVILPTTLPVTHQGDTTGLPNWVTSNRLEWTDAGDDSLKFVAPSAGNYAFAISAMNSDGGSSALGVSIRNFDNSLHAVQGCPAAGSTFNNDGVFESPGVPIALTAGQNVLVWISAPYWAAQKSGPYTLTITRQ